MKTFLIALLASLLTHAISYFHHSMTVERPEKEFNGLWLISEWGDVYPSPDGIKIHDTTTVELKTVCIKGLEYYVYSKSIAPKYHKVDDVVIPSTCNEVKQ